MDFTTVLICVLFVLAVFGCLWLLKSAPQDIDPASWATSYPALLLRGLLRACVKPQGVLPFEGPDAKQWKKDANARVDLPKEVKDALSATLRRWRLDPEIYAKYCKVCGYRSKGNSGATPTTAGEPFCFLETQFMRQFFTIATSKEFPLSPLGLIHLRQSISIYTSVLEVMDATCDLRCSVAEVRGTEKGIEVDMQCDVRATKGQKLLWSGVTTLLSRNQRTRTRRIKEMRAMQYSEPFFGMSDSFLSQQFAADSDVGLRYAAITGDYNPHHLYPWTARMVGYQQPMAHGMWTLAKALAVVQDNLKNFVSFPVELKVSFKLPLSLPSKATVLYTVPDERQRVFFEVRDVDTRQQLYLNGKIKCLY